MFSKILVALDGRDTGPALFEKAIALAQATKADLMLLSVLTPRDDTSLTMASYPGLGYYPASTNESVWGIYQKRYREAEAQGLKMLRSFTDHAIAAGVHTEFTQIVGSPGRAICDLAKTWVADLVMVGSHGRKGLGEMLLGSVSNYVMHHATCSVLVIHGQPNTETKAETENLAAVEG